MDPNEATLVQCAAFLHDVGHLPYSHTLEFVLHERFGIDHEDVSRRLIRGEESVLSPSDKRILGRYSSIPEVLERFGIDPIEVAGLLGGKAPSSGPQKTLTRTKGQTHFNAKRYLSQIINGPVDSDQLDYLKRDAHYTGVAFGVIDLERLFETLQVFNGDLVVERGGLSAIEGMLVARALMFSSVYFHKTVRISELMLAKAVEQLGTEEIDRMHSMTDSSLLAYLVAKGGYYEEVATLIKYRRLFKKTYAVRAADIPPEKWDGIDSLGAIDERRSLEEDIARRAGVDPGYVVVDVPSSELSISEPRIAMTEVRVLDGGKVKLLPRISSIAASLQIRRAHEWAIMVACPERFRDRVGKAAEKVVDL
jgi:HD superfamily phosphohydrolase